MHKETLPCDLYHHTNEAGWLCFTVTVIASHWLDASKAWSYKGECQLGLCEFSVSVFTVNLFTLVHKYTRCFTLSGHTSCLRTVDYLVSPWHSDIMRPPRVMQALPRHLLLKSVILKLIIYIFFRKRLFHVRLISLITVCRGYCLNVFKSLR